jgi:hypothetical protein
MGIILCETCENYKQFQSVRIPMSHADWIPCRDQWWDCMLGIEVVVDQKCRYFYEVKEGNQKHILLDR